MSNSLAVAAVTSTLRNLIDRGLRNGTVVTVQPPDRARTNQTGRQVNLFLYQVALNPAWRNMDMPSHTRSGETAVPPLPLNLYYLLTVYPTDNESDAEGQILLGRVLAILHDHPVLGRQEIKDALAGNDLYNQIERIRLTFQPLTLDDIFKLWSGYQTPYRLSVAYEATVVLIESTQGATTPLPVLTFGPEDSGPVAQADLTPPFPALTEVVPGPPFLPADPRNLRPAAEITPGATVTLRGFHLASVAPVAVRFRSAALSAIRTVNVQPGGTDDQVSFIVPPDLPAGFYTVSAAVTLARPDAPGGREERITNELPLALSPVIDAIAPANPVQPDVNGNLRLTVTCRPQIGPDQRATLLFGDREVRAEPRTGAASNLNVVVRRVAPGQYRVRLRVDGVDSPLIDWTRTPPAFLAPVVEVGP